MRHAHLLLTVAIVSCLLTLGLWLSRSTEAATVRTVVFSASGTEGRRAPAPTARSVKSALVGTLSNRSLPGSPSNAPEVFRKTTPSGNVLLWSDGALHEDGSFDVVIHFHGIPQALSPALLESKLRAVVLVLESGTMTTDYRDAYGLPGTLPRLLGAIRKQMGEAMPGKVPHERRVALSAWSAGSGALSAILKREEDMKSVDALIYSDGLHASFVDPKRREIGDFQLENVRRFAEQAMSGEKFLAITHSAIMTVDYASTTETARRLLELLSLTPVHVLDSPASEKPTLISRTERGEFSVLGFDGVDKQAHAQQQWAIGRILWSRLARRWNRER